VQASITPIDIEPNRMFLDGMKASARLLQANGRRIGYVHVWSYAGYAYQQALEHLLSEGILRDADALIWDLRDGWVALFLNISTCSTPGRRRCE
jgi:carboxyl-terminal processing protease